MQMKYDIMTKTQEQEREGAVYPVGYINWERLDKTRWVATTRSCQTQRNEDEDCPVQHGHQSSLVLTESRSFPFSPHLKNQEK
jgi:hypothetical protein